MIFCLNRQEYTFSQFPKFTCRRHVNHVKIRCADLLRIGDRKKQLRRSHNIANTANTAVPFSYFNILTCNLNHSKLFYYDTNEKVSHLCSDWM